MSRQLLRVALLVMAITFFILIVQQHRGKEQEVSTIIETKQQVLAALAAQMQIPQETAYLYQVKNLDLARQLNPTFYEHAEIGDWVIRFRHSIILFRFDTKQIIAQFAIVE